MSMIEIQKEIRRLMQVGMTEEQAERFVHWTLELIDQRCYLKSHHDRFEEKVMEKFSQIDLRFEKIEQRLDKLELRMDRLEERMDRLEERMDRLEERMDRIELQINVINQTLVKLVHAVEALNSKIK